MRGPKSGTSATTREHTDGHEYTAEEEHTMHMYYLTKRLGFEDDEAVKAAVLEFEQYEASMAAHDTERHVWACPDCKATG